MELRDYLRMLRRGWPIVALITLATLAAAAAYATLVPRQYDATSVLLVSASDARTITDLQQSGQFATGVVGTYALIVDSATVLGTVAEQIRPQVNVDDLEKMVTTRVEEDTSLINITVSGTDARQVADLANLTAQNASEIIPALEENARGRSLVRLQQIQEAVEPAIAVSPNVRRVLALGLVVGLCIGLATTITRQALDTRLQRLADVRQLTDRPLLGVLPVLGRGQRNTLVAKTEPVGAFGEALRTLRTNLAPYETQQRSLLVVGAGEDREGALVPANLAWSMAQAGQQVLLVDADLRHSPVSKIFGIPNDEGLSDALVGDSNLKDVFRSTDNPHLQVLTAGSLHTSPSELLSRPKLTELLREMESRFDRVVLHAPPLLSYTDAAVVAGRTSGTLLSVSMGSTRAQELQTAITALAHVRVEPLGIVATRTRPDAFDHGRRRSFGQRPALRDDARPQADWGWADDSNGNSSTPRERP